MEITYQVKYHPLVLKKDLPTLSAVVKQKIKQAIELKLMTRPELFGIPLRQSLKGHRKIRVGDYRVVFRIEQKMVLVLAILHRSVVYQKIPKRLP